MEEEPGMHSLSCKCWPTCWTWSQGQGSRSGNLQLEQAWS